MTDSIAASNTYNVNATGFHAYTNTNLVLTRSMAIGNSIGIQATDNGVLWIAQSTVAGNSSRTRRMYVHWRPRSFTSPMRPPCSG